MNFEEKSIAGNVFIISSPSGAGKTTVVNGIVKILKNIRVSLSVTTRMKRLSETQGKEYNFVSPEFFDKMIKNNEFLEYAKVFDNYYGTPAVEVKKLLQDGDDVVFDIDWQGAQQVEKSNSFRCVKIFIMPPSAGELFNRLKTRSQDSDKVIIKRMKGAKNEITHWSEYDYIVINYNKQETIDKIAKIIEVSRMHRTSQPNLFRFSEEICIELDHNYL